MSVTAAVLRELHRILRQLSDLKNRLQRGPRQIQVAESAIQRVDEELAANKERLTRTRITADQKELQLRQRENRIVDIKTKLNACSTNREYQAFLEQIAADEQANSVLSDEILELLDKVTQLQSEIKDVQTKRQRADDELAVTRKRIEGERAMLESEVARLSNDLTEAEKQLPGDFRIDFQRLVKARGEEALAQLEGECCGGCYTTVTTQTYNELRMYKLVSCKSCGCILYLPEDRDPANGG